MLECAITYYTDVFIARQPIGVRKIILKLFTFCDNNSLIKNSDSKCQYSEYMCEI